MAEVHLNGKHLLEEASVQITRNINSQAVNTVAKGYAGESPGAPICEMTVEGAVPADAAFDSAQAWGFLKSFDSLEVQEFAIYLSDNTTLHFHGFIISDSFSHAVNSESKCSFTVRGSYSEWQ